MALDLTRMQVLAKPVSSFYEGRAIRAAEDRSAKEGKLLDEQLAQAQIKTGQMQKPDREKEIQYAKDFYSLGRDMEARTLAGYQAKIDSGEPEEAARSWAQSQFDNDRMMMQRLFPEFKPNADAKWDPEAAVGAISNAESVLKQLQPKEQKAPETREFKVGNNIVTRQWDGKKWVDMEKAPRSEPGTSTEKPPSGYRWSSGGLEPIPGGPADPEGPAARKVAAPLRKEFRTLESVKAFETSLPLIKSAEKAPDTGYGDLQLIYTAGKILDPGSVVREGELALTVAAGSPLQRIIGQTRFTAEKGGRLTPQTRQQILGMLNERVSAYEQAYNQDRETYAQYAKDAGLDEQSIVGKHPTEAYGKSAKREGPVKVSTPEEAMKLPSGTQFMTPDGRLKVRP